MKMDRQTKIAIVINVAFMVFVFAFVALTTVGCTNTFIDLTPPCEADAGCDDVVDACDGDDGEDCS